MKSMIAIGVSAPYNFSPEHAIRGETQPKDDGFAVKIESLPPGLPIQGTGDWLEFDSGGNWQRRPTPNGSDAKFTASSNGYLVAAHRGDKPAFVLYAIQTWTE